MKVVWPPDSNSQIMVIRGYENMTYDIHKLRGLWVGHRPQEGSLHTQEQLSIRQWPECLDFLPAPET